MVPTAGSDQRVVGGGGLVGGSRDDERRRCALASPEHDLLSWLVGMVAGFGARPSSPAPARTRDHWTARVVSWGERREVHRGTRRQRRPSALRCANGRSQRLVPSARGRKPLTTRGLDGEPCTRDSPVDRGDSVGTSAGRGATDGDHLAVATHRSGSSRSTGPDHLGKVAGQRLLGAAAEHDLVPSRNTMHRSAHCLVRSPPSTSLAFGTRP